jgi:serine/threonine protein kinase
LLHRSHLIQLRCLNVQSIKHPNVVNYKGHALIEDPIKLLVIGMDLVVGQSYDKYLERNGALPWESAAKDFTQLVEGMGAVHAKGILHRDLKPGCSLPFQRLF